ncbi:hypothetical protein PLICRDRAFT_175628 [Plicaturopsis crispa FD-325 SS-3]|nr:hypothetical protein PLICRDRAFT_175628 [Plicaturopsis crispa FD-325 SS-3]
MSSQQKALWLTSKQGVFEVGPKNIPKPGPGELLVKIFAAALNPVDWKVQAHGFLHVQIYPAVLGSDASGTVEAVGEGVSGFTKGDRVLHQGFFNNDRAAFQQYAVVAAERAAKIPDNISFEEAASVPLGLATPAIGLYNSRDEGAGLENPWDEAGRGKYAGQSIFIVGGSSSVGQYTIQLAKLSGFSSIVATASPANTSLLTSLGATHVVDRSLPAADIVASVQKVAGGPVDVAFDSISLPETISTAYDAVKSSGILVLTLPSTVKETEGKNVYVVKPSGNVHLPPNRKLGASLYARLTALLGEGLIKPNKVEVLPNGLAGIPSGLERLKANKVSGLKLIARPQDTA